MTRGRPSGQRLRHIKRRGRKFAPASYGEGGGSATLCQQMCDIGRGPSMIIKREMKVSRAWIMALMGLWAIAMVIPAALPH